MKLNLPNLSKMPSIFLAVIPITIGIVSLFALPSYGGDGEVSLENLLNIAPLKWSSVYTSALCGLLVGWERQLKNKPTGMRTSILITLGTYVFVALALSVTKENASANLLGLTVVSDPSRIIGQVITGIGFLGGGVILARKGEVTGVTSAATVWLLAAIGVCIGVGAEATAIKLSILGTIILIGVDAIDDRLTTATKKIFHHKPTKRKKKARCRN